jgi:hypothetical protein
MPAFRVGGSTLCTPRRDADLNRGGAGALALSPSSSRQTPAAVRSLCHHDGDHVLVVDCVASPGPIRSRQTTWISGP